jgi:hypothetical protein
MTKERARVEESVVAVDEVAIRPPTSFELGCSFKALP